MIDKPLTGDDDSVEHSQNTELVWVRIDADRLIASLVREMNFYDFVRTYSSCAGHLHSEIERRAYVDFSSASNTFDYRLATCGVPHEVVRHSEGNFTLFVEPADIDRLAEALSKS